MTAVRKDLERYAHEQVHSAAGRPRQSFAPRAFDALRLVLAASDRIDGYAKSAREDGDKGRADAYAEAHIQIRTAIEVALEEV